MNPKIKPHQISKSPFLPFLPVKTTPFCRFQRCITRPKPRAAKGAPPEVQLQRLRQVLQILDVVLVSCLYMSFQVAFKIKNKLYKRISININTININDDLYIYIQFVYAYMHVHGPVCGLLLSNHIDPQLLTGGRGTVVDLGWSWFCTIFGKRAPHILR